MYPGEEEEVYSSDVEYYQKGSGAYTDLFSSMAKQIFQSAAESGSKKLGDAISTKVVNTIDKKLINKPKEDLIKKPVVEEPIKYEVEMVPLKEVSRGIEIKHALEGKSEELKPKKNNTINDRVRALI